MDPGTADLQVPPQPVVEPSAPADTVPGLHDMDGESLPADFPGCGEPGETGPHHYGSRDALVAAAMDWAAEQSISASKLREAAELGESFTESLLEFLLAEPELQVFQYEMILEARRRPELAALYENYVSALAEGLRASGLTRNVDVVARTLFASLDGLVLQYLAGVERAAIAASLKEVHEVLLLRTGAQT